MGDHVLPSEQRVREWIQRRKWTLRKVNTRRKWTQRECEQKENKWKINLKRIISVSPQLRTLGLAENACRWAYRYAASRYQQRRLAEKEMIRGTEQSAHSLPGKQTKRSSSSTFLYSQLTQLNISVFSDLLLYWKRVGRYPTVCKNSCMYNSLFYIINLMVLHVSIKIWRGTYLWIRYLRYGR